MGKTLHFPQILTPFKSVVFLFVFLFLWGGEGGGRNVSQEYNTKIPVTIFEYTNNQILTPPPTNLPVGYFKTFNSRQHFLKASLR